MQKQAFRICWGAVDVGVILIRFSVALGANLMTFGSNVYDFRWLSGGSELRDHGWLRVFGCLLGSLVAVTKQYGVALQHAKYSIKPAGIKGYEKTRMQITKIQKIIAAI